MRHMPDVLESARLSVVARSLHRRGHGSRAAASLKFLSQKPRLPRCSSLKSSSSRSLCFRHPLLSVAAALRRHGCASARLCFQGPVLTPLGPIKKRSNTQWSPVLPGPTSWSSRRLTPAAHTTATDDRVTPEHSPTRGIYPCALTHFRALNALFNHLGLR